MATFTSYAQNFEDIMLWRALKHVEQGRYIDIGAQHPVVDSVSKAFHERGWLGIHVEPVRYYADMLRADRPGDTVMEIAISDQDGILELQVIPDTGLSTGVKQYAESHHRNRGFQHQSVMVPMLPVRSAFASIEGQPIHWMKIDIEGLEEAALRGWDSQRLRPWVIVIEATVPLSSEQTDFDMDGVLERAGYGFVYFDGLNRFYVANEHPELLKAFQCPPNVFDDVVFSVSSPWSALARAQLDAEKQAADRMVSDLQLKLTASAADIHAMRSELARAHEHSVRLKALVADAEQARAESMRTIAEMRGQTITQSNRAEVAELEVRALRTSTSWRLTRPIRLVVSTLRGQLAPQELDRIARLARRFGLFGPARSIYRAFRRSSQSQPTGAQDTASYTNHVASTAATARFEGATTLDVQEQALSDDARRLLRQIRPRQSPSLEVN